MDKKYTIIDKFSLATTLNFMGFEYKKSKKDNRDIYIFVEDERFKFALAKILETRQLIRNNQ